MTTLTIDAIDAITKWADKFNPAAGQALIDAAARSPYLASQFNQFVAARGEFAAPTANSASAETKNGITIINIGTDLANNYLSTPAAKDQLATVLAHEMGHALSAGGMSTATVIPTQAVAASRQAEGVALTSEMIVSYQLGLGNNGNYSYSDRGGLNQPSGALAQQFNQQIALESDAVSLWTLDSTSAKSFVNYSVSPIAQTYGRWSGQATPSVAPRLTYDQYNEAWAALNACGPDNSPVLIDWTKVEPASVQLNINPDGSCRITTPKALPRLDGSKVGLDSVIDPFGNPLSVSASVDMQSNGSVDQTTTRNWLADNVTQTDTFMGPPAPNTLPDSSTLNMGTVNYDLFDAAQNNDASYKMWQLNQSSGLSSSGYNSFTEQSSNFVVNYSLGGSGNSNLGQLKPPSNFDLFPIGAFYDSQSAAYDNAASIAHKTTRAMDASGQGLSAAQLAALDANADGTLSVQEASSVRLWADLNENGQLDTNELQSVGSGITAADYGFYSRGNDAMGGYAGDDKVYGEEDDDVLCGQGANQTFANNDSTWRQAA
jgi:hypothetical protein